MAWLALDKFLYFWGLTPLTCTVVLVLLLSQRGGGSIATVNLKAPFKTVVTWGSMVPSPRQITSPLLVSHLDLWNKPNMTCKKGRCGPPLPSSRPGRKSSCHRAHRSEQQRPRPGQKPSAVPPHVQTVSDTEIHASCKPYPLFPGPQHFCFALKIIVQENDLKR